MPKKWRIGLVGCYRGASYGRLAYHHPDCEIAAICDSDPRTLGIEQKSLCLPDDRCFHDYGDLIQCLPTLDAVIIGTPIPAHATQAVQALDAGIHVLSEVTASNSIEGCAAIVEAARRSRRIYMLAENTIYRPLFAEWGGLIGSGKLGEIFYAEADYIHPIPELLVNPETGERCWRADRPPIHYCSHSLGPILYLTGDRIVRAMGIGDGQRTLPGIGVGAVDIQLGVFETARGVIIKMTRTQVAPRHYPIHYYYLQGTKGFVETSRGDGGFDHAGQSGFIYLRDEMEHTQPVVWPEQDASAPGWAGLGGHGIADYRTLLAFLAALETNMKPVLDEVRAWDLTVPGLIAAESALKRGEWLEVPAAR